MYQKYVYILLFKTCRNTNLNSPPLLEKINNLYIKLFSSICKNTVGLRLHKDNKLLAKRVYEPFIFLPYYLKIQCL